MRLTRTEETITGKQDNAEFTFMLFDRCDFRNARFYHSKFTNIHFKNTYLHYSRYVECAFSTCKFWGKYATLGAKYEACRFTDCDFSSIMQFNGARFFNCYFSGAIKDAIIHDWPQGWFSKKFVFNRCDLGDIVFHNLDLRGRNIFKDCILPRKGIRRYRNDNNTLLDRAAEICSKISNLDKVESQVIFDRKLKSGQNPIILDDIFLGSFFKTTESREVFDSIVSGFEIEES